MPPHRLQNDLVMIDKELETIVAFVALCNKLDTKCRALLGNSRQHDLHSQAPKHIPQATPSSATESATTSFGTAPGPMDLSANRRCLSPEERAWHLAEGCCYHCGGMGHMAQACPLGQHQKPMRAMDVVVVLVQPEAPRHRSCSIFRGLAAAWSLCS